MCEANVYISENGSEKLLVERANIIIPKEDGSIYIEDIFGERKTIMAKIKKMELVDHKIVLQK